MGTSDAKSFNRILSHTSIIRLSNLGTPELMVAVRRFVLQKTYATMLSRGSGSSLADCSRLLERCTKQAAKCNAAEVCQVFEIVFGLLDHIDECEDDIVFFAGEDGSWQMGFDWEKVLPAWLSALSATVAPAEYARRIDVILNRHYADGRVEMLSVAQSRALPKL